MTSSASLKDVSKAIVAFVHEPTLPLPDDLCQIVDAYVNKHKKYDEATSERVQEELSSIFEKHVKDTPAAWAPWIAVIRRFLWTLHTADRILKWSDIMESGSHDKAMVTECSATMMDVVAMAERQMEYEDADMASSPFIDALLSTWMNRLYPAVRDGSASLTFAENLTRDTLVQFGRRHPKRVFIALNRYFAKKNHRKAVLRFLGDYLHCQPPHVHVAIETPLFGSLLQCLQRDTSTTVVSTALTVLIMILPHMPSSLVPYLPTLFNIYARLLFWARERADRAEPLLEDAEQTNSWELYDYNPEIDDYPIDNLLNYYSILYGLYPINFMDYIRKPQRYLRHAHVANADDIEVQPTEIRHQSERFRQRHILHPNFYTLTIDSEKTDFGRFIKCEAAEVVAECTGLCLNLEPGEPFYQEMHHAMDTSIPILNEVSDDEDSESALLSRSTLTEPHGDRPHDNQLPCLDSVAESRIQSALARKGSQSSRFSSRDPGADSPTLPGHLTPSSSHTQLQDMIKSNKAIKSGLSQSLANESVNSLTASHHESVAEKPAGPSGTVVPTTASSLSIPDPNLQIAHLQRQILLLQNDLNFEKYLKQQHMAYIGDLRRRKLEEAQTEAETQNLIMTNRNLKSRYEEAKKAEMQIRKESEKSRTIAKKWEADLANKLKNLRDECKRLKAEIEALHKELENDKVESEKLRTLVCNAEEKELSLRQNMQSIEIKGQELDKLKEEVERLTVAERDHSAREIEREAAINSATRAEEKAEVMAIELAARKEEVERMRDLFQPQIAELQMKLVRAQEGGKRTPMESVETALAASREKQAEMQRQYDLLMRKYTALQSSLLDMRTENPRKALRIETSNLQDGMGNYLSSSASPVMMKARPHRQTSSPDASDGAHNLTTMLDSNLETPTSLDWPHRAGSPPVMEGSRNGSLSMSPDHRSFGRNGSGRLLSRSHSDLFASGIQNRLRRDSKDKTREDGTKKERKSSRLGGIRGFM